MASAVQDLMTILDLEPLEVNLFRGRSPQVGWQRVFGGQVAGQALVAATRTVEAGRHVHSLHAYFLRAGDPRIPILYEVDRIRDGRSFVPGADDHMRKGDSVPGLVGWEFHGDPAPIPGLEVVAEGIALSGGVHTTSSSSQNRFPLAVSTISPAEFSNNASSAPRCSASFRASTWGSLFAVLNPASE